MCLCLCIRGLGVSTIELHHTVRKTTAIFKATHPRIWYRLGVADSIGYCVTLSTLIEFFFFTRRYTKEHVYAVPASNIEDIWRYRGNVRCRRFRSTHYRLLWKGRRMLRTPTAIARRQWFIHSTPWVLRRRRVSPKLNLSARLLIKIIDISFKKNSH